MAEEMAPCQGHQPPCSHEAFLDHTAAMIVAVSTATHPDNPVAAAAMALAAVGSWQSEWVRSPEPGWFLAGYDADPGWLVTDDAIRRLGRKGTEKLIAGLPPLPARAWDVLGCCVACADPAHRPDTYRGHFYTTAMNTREA